MTDTGLIARLKAESGMAGSASFDPYALAGFFNRYRPHGAGLEKVLDGDDSERAVLARILTVFAASAPGRLADDLYFIVRQPAPLSDADAARLLKAHLDAMQRLAEYHGDTEAVRAIAALTIVPAQAQGPADDDVATMLYECLTDFLSELQPAQDVLFVLKEALYSMAADYYLMAYMLWPAVERTTGLPPLLDAYFGLWRAGLRLAFSADGKVWLQRAA